MSTIIGRAIIAGGGGAKTLVYTVSGATVTAVNGSSTVTAAADATGKVELTLGKSGVWNITAEKDGKSSLTKQVALPPTLMLPLRPVANISPTSGVTYTDGLDGATPELMHLYGEAISDNAEILRTTSTVYLDFGADSRKLTVGDVMDFSINGTTVQARLISFNTDDLADTSAYGEETATGKCGMTFDTVTIVTSAQMNTGNTNVGGWEASRMRSTTMPELLASIPEAWRDVLMTRSLTNNKGTTPTEDILSLHSQNDIGSSGYNWYAAGNSKVKNNASGSAVGWWLRGADTGGSAGFLVVDSRGGVGDGHASGSGGVVPGFAF